MTLKFCNDATHNVNWIKERPIAHRALHDKAANVYENTLSAVKRAIDKNYTIEVDLQPSNDHVPMVFHDYNLDRMALQNDMIRQLPAAEIAKISIMETDDTIPTLSQLLGLVNGKVGLVLELKGQNGADDGFVAAVSEALKSYDGPVAIMSFAHHLLRDARDIASHLPLGLTAEGDDTLYEAHREIALECNVDFVSYEVENLETRFAREFRQTGRPLISWTIRNQKEVDHAYKFSDQPTFENIVL